MFDIGWQELFIVGLLAVIVMGPKELPRALRTVTGLVRKARSMAGEFQRGLDDMVREADLEDIKKQMEDASTMDVKGEIENVIDPDGDLKKEMDISAVEADLDSYLEDDPEPAPTVMEPLSALAEPASATTDPASTIADDDPEPSPAVAEPTPEPELEPAAKASG